MTLWDQVEDILGPDTTEAFEVRTDEEAGWAKGHERQGRGPFWETGCQIPWFSSLDLFPNVLVYYNILFILLIEYACSSLHV